MAPEKTAFPALDHVVVVVGGSMEAPAAIVEVLMEAESLERPMRGSVGDDHTHAWHLIPTTNILVASARVPK